MYKLNIHAHTFFSDGRNSPLKMALSAKELGFTALVVTDHYYPHHSREGCSTNTKRFRLMKKATIEASEVLPVITGIELAFGGEEMLVFGKDFIATILRHCDQGNELTVELLAKWKKRKPSACMLSHPIHPNNWENLMPLLDGYERWNSATDMFPDKFRHTRPLHYLSHLPGWCNSDAHNHTSLSKAYNLTDVKIEDEESLIKYIREHNQPKYVVNGKLVNES